VATVSAVAAAPGTPGEAAPEVEDGGPAAVAVVAAEALVEGCVEDGDAEVHAAANCTQMSANTRRCRVPTAPSSHRPPRKPFLFTECRGPGHTLVWTHAGVDLPAPPHASRPGNRIHVRRAALAQERGRAVVRGRVRRA